MGLRAQEKKKLIKEGKLDPKGKINEKTPRAWILQKGRYSYLPMLIGDEDEQKETEIPNVQDVQVVAKTEKDSTLKRKREAIEDATTDADSVVVEKKKKKKKKHKVDQQEA